jgi:DNA (cytosine-5)-methyltransferase 1
VRHLIIIIEDFNILLIFLFAYDIIKKTKKEVIALAVNYNKLWKQLIDHNMNRTQLRCAAHISTNAIAKLGKNEAVSVDTLEKICRVLQCDVGDIMEIDFSNSLKDGE